MARKNGDQHAFGTSLLAKTRGLDPGVPPPPAQAELNAHWQQQPGATAGKGKDAARRKLGVIEFAKRTWANFSDDDCTTLGASMAYFTVFSLTPLLLTIISIAGLVMERESVQASVTGQVNGLLGAGAAQQVQSMLQHAAANKSGGIAGTVIGILVLIFGATGAFTSLQDALNKTWHVKPDPAKGGIRAFLMKRVLSFGMILGVVFLLMASLVVSAALAAFGSWLGGVLPQPLTGAVARVLSETISLIVISVLFAFILKMLPDGHVAWNDVWVGSIITGVLFTIGKTGIALYLGKTATASAYGAAGSLVAIVLWLYYASLILLFGAEFTRVWAETHGRAIEPEKDAVRVVVSEQHQR